jgi:hypothetical protein
MANKQVQFVNFYSIGWVQEMTELVELLDPNDKSYWNSRLNLELQSKLTWYIVQLGQFMRSMQNEYNKKLWEYRQQTKSKADAEILAQQTSEFNNWKLAKTYREDLTNLIYALRAEVRLELQDARNS